jgi:hypothetical protein
MATSFQAAAAECPPLTSPGAAAPPSGRASTVGPLALAAILVAILLANYCLRHNLDRANRHVNSFLGVYYKDQLPEIYSLQWWQYLLPIKCLTGSWCSTSLLTVHGLELLLGSPHRVYYLANAVMLVTSFCLSWWAFRSLVFTVTLSLCLAFSTVNYHVYVVSGGVALPLIVSYLLFFLFCQYKLLEAGCRYAVWAPAGVIALLLLALSYESWLDCVAWMWLAYPVVIALLYRARDRRHLVATAVLVAVTLAAVGYVIAKRQLGHGQTAGSESDTVFNYGLGNAVLAVEDVVCHYFTLLYVTVSTYLPPEVCSYSVSSWALGPERIVALQHGYHDTHAHLVAYNHMFLWRFYAGVAVAVLGYWFWRRLGAAWRNPTRDSLALFLFLSMVMVSGPTHMLVKYRPMHSTPFLGYHSFFGVVGLSLLLAALADACRRHSRRPRVAWVVIAVLWANVVYCGLARPSLLSHMATQCGFPPYPDPLANLRALTGF